MTSAQIETIGLYTVYPTGVILTPEEGPIILSARVIAWRGIWLPAILDSREACVRFTEECVHHDDPFEALRALAAFLEPEQPVEARTSHLMLTAPQINAYARHRAL